MITRRSYHRIARAAVLVSTLPGLGLGCRGGGGSPIAPTPLANSVSITYPGGGPIFIGSTVQFEARETSSDGSMRAATGVTWGSDAPAVATVSATGLVTAIAAGEATIFADGNGRRTLRIRVLPNFAGVWAGTEVVTGCEDSEAFEGLCADLLSLGAVGGHSSAFTQVTVSVDARIDTGGGTAATMTGDVSVGGELQLPSASSLPAGPRFTVELQNWRSRADTPSRMTGTYDLLFTASDMAGFVRMRVRLENVVRSGATATVSPNRNVAGFARVRPVIERHLLGLVRSGRD